MSISFSAADWLALLTHFLSLSLLAIGGQVVRKTLGGTTQICIGVVVANAAAPAIRAKQYVAHPCLSPWLVDFSA